MLDKVFTAIDPANFEVQILEIFNQIFPLALNDSLNHEVFGEKINYSFYSNTHGEMKMNIIHKLFSFGVKPEKGYHVVFVTEIENWPEPICNQNITDEPYDFMYSLPHSVSTEGLRTSTSTAYTSQWLATYTPTDGSTWS